MKNRIYIGMIALLTVFVAFSATAFAAGQIAPTDGNIWDHAKPIYDAIVGGQWWLAASLALVFAVAAFKKYAGRVPKYGPKLDAFANSDHGGALLVLVGAYGGALATGLVASGLSSLTLALAWAALKVAVGAAGGYSLVKKLVLPVLRKIADKAPSWAKPIFTLVFWAFEKTTPTEQAEQAGDDAVKANPASGADGVIGKPTDI